MPTYLTSVNHPQVGAQNFIYDTVSGYYRTMLDTDFTNSGAVTKLNTNNGYAVTQSNPIPVKMGGSSSTAFGEVLTSSVTPEIQQFLTSLSDNREWTRFSGQNDGYFTVGTGLGVISIGSTVLAYASIRTKASVRYNPGQGAVSRFTAAFNSGIASSLQLAGAYHAEDGLLIGYSGTQFGICHRYGRKLEIQKLTLSGASTAAGNVTVTLNGHPNTVRINAAGNTWGDARDITTGNSYFEVGPLGLRYLYDTMQTSGAVYFFRNTHGATTGAFSFASGTTNASGSFSRIQGGAVGTEDWTMQSSWNQDSMTGNGPSSMNLNPQNLNIYEIKYGWLGTLPIKISVGNETTQEIVPVHLIQWTNKKSIPSFEDPRFPVAYSVASAGSTSALSVKGASCYAAIEGPIITRHNDFSFFNEVTAGTVETPILSVQNSRIDLQNGKFNRRRFYLDTIYITNESATKAVTIKIYQGRQANLLGSNFAIPDSLDSIALVDKNATALRVTSDLINIITVGLAPLSTQKIEIDKHFFPLECCILTSSTSSSTAVVLTSINGYEDN